MQTGTINRTQAERLLRSTSFVTAEFITKTGARRTMNCLYDGSTRGKGRYVVVVDIDINDYRTINLGRLRRLYVDNGTYEVVV